MFEKKDNNMTRDDVCRIIHAFSNKEGKVESLGGVGDIWHGLSNNLEIIGDKSFRSLGDFNTAEEKFREHFKQTFPWLTEGDTNFRYKENVYAACRGYMIINIDALSSLGQYFESTDHLYPVCDELIFGTIKHDGRIVPSGILGTWHKKVGDIIEIDEPIVSVQGFPFGGDHTICYKRKGVLTEILKEEGGIVKVNEAIAIISKLPEEVIELDGIKFKSQIDADDYKELKRINKTFLDPANQEFLHKRMELSAWEIERYRIEAETRRNCSKPRAIVTTGSVSNEKITMAEIDGEEVFTTIKVILGK